MKVTWAPGIPISAVPLRKVVRRSSAITNGWHRTSKNPMGFCAGESRGELDFMMFAEMDPNVTAVMPQPCVIPFSDGARLRRHFPDFAVMERSESIIFEAKSRRQYLKPDLQRRLRAAARSVEARNWPYFVALREDILEDPRYPNVLDVWRRFRPSFTPIQRMAVEEAIGIGERRIADVVAGLSHMGDAAPALKDVLSLAANGHVFIDVTNPIGDASLVRVADRRALPDRLLPRRRPADDLPWEQAA